jgi:hypothetical protein
MFVSKMFGNISPGIERAEHAARPSAEAFPGFATSSVKAISRMGPAR